MVIKQVYDELVEKLSPIIIQKNMDRDGGTAFEYVLSCIRDMFGYSKPEGWETAEAICKHFNMR